MERAVAIFVIFTFLLWISIEHKTFFVKTRPSAPLPSDMIISRVEEKINRFGRAEQYLRLSSLGIKIRVSRVIREIMRIDSACAERFALDKLYEVLDRLDEILGLCDDNTFGMRYPAELGVPRIFSLCAEIAEKKHGALTAAQSDEISETITGSSELFECEKKAFRGVLEMCFCDIAVRIATRVVSAAKDFCRGRNDGLNEKICLMSIKSGAYTAGMISALDEGGIREYSELAERNGISVDDVSAGFYRRLAADLADTFCAYLSVLTALGSSGSDVFYFSSVRPFGGETEYKSNSMANPAVSLSTDNRGKVELCSNGLSIPIDVRLKSSEQVLSLAACDGIMTYGRTVYRAARADVEMRCELTVPPDLCAQCLRVSVISRTNKPIAVDLAVNYGVCGDIVYADGNGATYKYGNGFIGLFADENVFDRFGGVGFERSLRPFERASFTLAVVFGEKHVVAAKGALAVGDGFFDRAALACSLYARFSGKGTSSRRDSVDIMRGVEYYSAASAHRHGKAENAEIEYGSYENGFRARTDSGLCNISADGEYSLKCYADGKCNSSCGNNAIYEKTFVVIETDGYVFSPSSYPCGSGEMYAEFNSGVSVYGTSFRGLVCKLERFIARGKNAERFTLHVENRTNKTQVAYAMISAVLCGDALFEKTETSVTANRSDGYSVTVASARPAYDRAFFAEGYFKHGEIDRAAAFRNGGNTSAPTLAVKLVIPSYGTETADFALIFSQTSPSNEFIGSVFDYTAAREKLLTDVGNGIYIMPMTSNDVFNAVYMRAEYLTLSCGSRICEKNPPRAENAVVSMLLTSEDLYRRGKYDPALRALLSAMNDADETALLYRDDDSYMIAAKLIYRVVTKNFLGISVHGETVRINPKIENCPFSVFYDIRSKYGTTEVAVDCSARQGDFFIKQGRITRPSGTVNLSDCSCVTVERNGTRQVHLLDTEFTV